MSNKNKEDLEKLWLENHGQVVKTSVQQSCMLSKRRRMLSTSNGDSYVWQFLDYTSKRCIGRILIFQFVLDVINRRVHLVTEISAGPIDCIKVM